MEIIFLVVILVFSASIHEYMHGWMANQLGDPTAKLAGRLTLNPIKHLDWFGSVILPFLLVITNVGFVFGWAKPVPFNPYNLRDKKYGPAKVALAGPLGNFILAFILALAWRFFFLESEQFDLFMVSAIFINLILMIFNLIPIPPLDGSKILAAFLPSDLAFRYLSLERYGFLFILIFIMFGFQIILPLTYFLLNLLTSGIA